MFRGSNYLMAPLGQSPVLLLTCMPWVLCGTWRSLREHLFKESGFALRRQVPQSAQRTVLHIVITSFIFPPAFDRWSSRSPEE